MEAVVRRQPASTPPPVAPRPCAGMLQCDRDGQVWLCEAVIRNGDLADYFLVRLSRVDGHQPVGDPVVLSPSEYSAFIAQRRLEPVLL